MFENKVTVITGGASGIGKAIAERFAALGASVGIIDTKVNDFFVGDVADKMTLERFAKKIIAAYGKVDFLINNAPPAMAGIGDCPYEDFENALKTGLTAPFYLAKLFDKYFAQGASIINISSTRAHMSQPNTESYTAAKGGLSALTHALAVSLAGRVRVNTISPGWIDTSGAEFSGADACQHPVGKVGKPSDIAEMVMYLCSDRAGFITGQDFVIDGGMSRQMIYHGDGGWTLE